jgi:hypothetical protein
LETTGFLTPKISETSLDFYVTIPPKYLKRYKNDQETIYSLAIKLNATPERIERTLSMWGLVSGGY